MSFDADKVYGTAKADELKQAKLSRLAASEAEFKAASADQNVLHTEGFSFIAGPTEDQKDLMAVHATLTAALIAVDAVDAGDRLNLLAGAIEATVDQLDERLKYRASISEIIAAAQYLSQKI